MPDRPPGRPSEGTFVALTARVSPAEARFVKHASSLMHITQAEFVRTLIRQTLFDWNTPNYEEEETTDG